MSHRIATSAAIRAAALIRCRASSSSSSSSCSSSITATLQSSASVIISNYPSPGNRKMSYSTKNCSYSSNYIHSSCSSSSIIPAAAHAGRGGLHHHHHHHGVTSPTHRAISSTSPLSVSPANKKEIPIKPPTTSKDEDDDPCPPWQNPLHHNNPTYQKVLAEDFAPGEEMPLVPLPPFETDETEGKVLASQELHDLANEIVRLNLLEVKELVDRMGDHFGFDDDDDGDFEDGGDGDGGGAEEEAVVEKTVFDLKLTGFDAKSKIKVIKEVRAITSLGLKEAKELVEGAPTNVKKDIKKEEAEELKTKLEAVGATIEIV